MEARTIVRAVFASVCVVVCSGGAWYMLHAAALTRVSDLISTSLPSATSTHTITFTATQAIPPLGKIVLTPQPGEFTIPSGFDYTDIDLAVATSGPYVDRELDGVASTTADVVTVVSGTNGSITFTLISGIAAGERVHIELGDNATHAFFGDERIQNPADAGSYRVTVETRDALDAPLDGAQAMIVVILPVTVTAINENEPPVRADGLPSGTIAAGNDEIEISLTTNEIAECRYSTTSGVDYNDMTEEFTVVGGQLFYAVVTGHQNNATYTYYVRCEDVYDTVNEDDYAITFALDVDPISDTSIPQPGSAGTSGASDSDGPFEGGVDTLYRSTVTLAGLSSPQSTVTVVKDGVSYGTAQAGSDGSFSTTISSLERGSYTFLAYALDRANRKSSAYSSTLSVSQGTNNTLSDIVIPPTIGVQEEMVEPDADILIQGEGVPNSTIQISATPVRGGAARTMTTITASDGMWELAVGGGALSRGVYKLRARSVVSDRLQSADSEAISLGVGEDPSAEPLEPTGAVDINGDGKVNLVDFSIMLAAWGTDDPGSDFNGDGTVNLADFSILLFNWTG